MKTQDIHSEQVIANLSGTSFLTETGLIIEGNYRKGDHAPVIYDKDSRRYLPAWKREPVGGEEPLKVVDDGHVSVVFRSSQAMVLYYQGLGRVTFEGGDFRYYIDVSSLVANDAVVRVLEADANWGAIIWAQGAATIRVFKFHLEGLVDPRRTVQINKIVGMVNGGPVYQAVEYDEVAITYQYEDITVPFESLQPPEQLLWDLPEFCSLRSDVLSGHGFMLRNVAVYLIGEVLREAYKNITFDAIKVHFGIQFEWYSTVMFWAVYPSGTKISTDPLYYGRFYLADYSQGAWTFRNLFMPKIGFVYSICDLYYPWGSYTRVYMVILDSDGKIAMGSWGTVKGYIPVLTDSMNNSGGFLIQWFRPPWYGTPCPPLLPVIPPDYYYFWNNCALPSPYLRSEFWILYTPNEYRSNWRTVDESEIVPWKFMNTQYGGGKVQRAMTNPIVSQVFRPIYFIEGSFFKDIDEIPSGTRATLELVVAKFVLGLNEAAVFVEVDSVNDLYCKFVFSSTLGLVSYCSPIMNISFGFMGNLF